jgi:hypothetical protein
MRVEVEVEKSGGTGVDDEHDVATASAVATVRTA